jgi:hypothetical protein
MKFMERMSPLFPYYTPKTFKVETSSANSVTITSNITWSKIQRLTPAICKSMSLADLVNTIEYTLSCAHGKNSQDINF